VSAQTVSLGGKEYTVSALPIATLRKQWARIGVLISLVLALVQVAAKLMAGITAEGKADIKAIAEALGSDAFGQAVAGLVAQLNDDQLDLLLQLLFEALAVTAPREFNREKFDELVTVDALPALAKAFLAAQGISWGKKGEVSQGEAGAAPAAT
jgi:hypothetical protein